MSFSGILAYYSLKVGYLPLTAVFFAGASSFRAGLDRLDPIQIDLRLKDPILINRFGGSTFYVAHGCLKL